MDVITCKKCNRLFNYLGGIRMCQACKDDLEKKFVEVKEYIREHPGANMNAIAADNDVTVAIIKQWIREERLEFTEDSPITMNCEHCGKKIRTGRYCEDCKKKTAGTMESAIRKPVLVAEPAKTKHDKGKMRFLEQ